MIPLFAATSFNSIFLGQSHSRPLPLINNARADAKFGAQLDQTQLSTKLKSTNIVLADWGQYAKFSGYMVDGWVHE